MESLMGQNKRNARTKQLKKQAREAILQRTARTNIEDLNLKQLMYAGMVLPDCGLPKVMV